MPYFLFASILSTLVVLPAFPMEMGPELLTQSEKSKVSEIQNKKKHNEFISTEEEQFLYGLLVKLGHQRDRVAKQLNSIIMDLTEIAILFPIECHTCGEKFYEVHRCKK